MMIPVFLGATESESFDYTSLDQATRKLVEKRTNEIKGIIRQTAKGVIVIGVKLIECKAELGHGKFGQWIKAEFGWGNTTAWKMMRVANTFKISQCENLNIATSALYLLAEPSTPEEARQEALERATRGETITHANAKEILSYHTIDVEAEVLDEGKELPSATPGAKTAFTTSYEVGDRVIILRRQHLGKNDKWVGKIARIWEVTPDIRLRVDVEGHKGVRFTLNPDWVKPVTESPEKYQAQPEPTSSQQADESDPESPAIPDMASEGQEEAAPRFQAGDRLQGTNLGQHNQEWTGEVAEVLEVTDTTIKVILQIPRSPQ